jgi:S1-C subfamily serine protease
MLGAIVAVALVVAGLGIGRALDAPPDPAPSGPAKRDGGRRGGGSREPVSAVARGLLPTAVQIETDAGLGSGVVYDDAGLILTAAHVVGSERKVLVRLATGRRLPGRVVGNHAATDVAVVRVPRRNLPVAPLGAGVPVRVGQIAVAIGSPFGLEGSVTSGVVSAVERSVPVDGGRSTASMIQTDAPINPGNSGGALANRDGLVIGINDAIRSRTGVNSGVGFAIPIDTALSVAKALVRGRTPRLGWLGVSGTEPARGHGGALVTSVKPHSPTDRAGLRRGDIIIALDGAPIDGMSSLAARVRAARPGAEVTLTVRRGGRRIPIEVRIGSQ